MSQKLLQPLFFSSPTTSYPDDTYMFEQVVSPVREYPYAFKARHIGKLENIIVLLNHEEIAELVAWLKRMSPIYDEPELY